MPGMKTEHRTETDGAPLSPCVNVCRLDVRGWCVGCRRSADEIMRWRDMSQAERWRVMHEVLPRRWQD